MTMNEMVLQAQQGDGAILEELFERFQGLFFRAARQRHLRTVFEDALQAARESFLRAVRDFDAALGVPFEGFLKRRVYGDLHTFFRRERAYWQREVHPGDGEEGDGFWDMAEDASAGRAENCLLLRDALARAIRTLSPREKELLSLVYLADTTLREAACRLGLTPAYAAVVKRRALLKLRRRLEKF
ncbi:sigma-70 family RNA polymerase sigma factor [Selenomonas sputigena]|uniref:Sigma-70 family RNA polymerase sigma factor n=1 Tax=Selenomonas sputigena TaxID=69823 RepID=A0ABV3X4M7_9FIRM